MLPLEGKSIIATTVLNAAQVCRSLVVVTGYRADEMERHLGEISLPENVILHTVRNRTWERGMFSSIQCGVHFFTLLFGPDNPEGQPFFITLGDMPSIPPESYRDILALSTEREEQVIRPLYQGKPAHPVFCRFLVAERILQEPHSSAMKQVLDNVPVHAFEVGEKHHFIDVDTPESYARLTGGMVQPQPGTEGR